MENKLGWVVLLCILVLGTYLIYPRISGMITVVDSSKETTTTTIETTTTTISIEQLSACPIEDLKEMIQQSAMNNKVRTYDPGYEFRIKLDMINGFESEALGWAKYGPDEAIVKCRYGNEVGEYTYYLYCRTQLWLRKTIISSEGQILKKVVLSIDDFILNPRKGFEIIEFNCREI